MRQHPAAGAGARSVTFQPRTLAAATTVRGAKNYSELLAQGPVLETLEIVERHFRSIVPDHEL
jgi:hypothetical protein